MWKSILNSKGQVTIPASVRRMLGLKPGDQVVFMVENGRVMLVPGEDRIEAAFGLIKAETSVSIEDMERTIRERTGQCQRHFHHRGTKTQRNPNFNQSSLCLCVSVVKMKIKYEQK